MTGTGVEVNDLIFVARGSYHPLVLRPAELDYEAPEGDLDEEARQVVDQESRTAGQQVVSAYRLVTGAFVHGITDGEFMAMIDAGKIEERYLLLV